MWKAYVMNPIDACDKMDELKFLATKIGIERTSQAI